MTSKAKILPIRILKLWFDFVLIIGGVAVALFLGYLAVSPLLLSGTDQPLDAVVQVTVGERSWKPVQKLQLKPISSKQVEQARLVDTTGELHLLTKNRWFHYTSLGEIVLAATIIFYVIWLLRKILINVLDDNPFAASNGKYLQRSGYIVLILGLGIPPLDYALSSYALSTIVVSNLDLQPALTLNKDVFVVGLLLLVFGFILERGHQLQEHEQKLEEDQALTI